MQQDPVRLFGCKHPLHAVQHRRCYMDEVLLRLHDPEIMIRRQPEKIEDPREHVAVLAGQANDRTQPPAGRQRRDDRRHLDGLGPGAEYDENLHLFAADHRWVGARRRS